MGIKADIEQIARDHLGVETLETRGRDALDFHEVSVAAIRSALLAAWMGGIQECAETEQQEKTMSETFKLEVTGELDLQFVGEKIASTSNSADRGHSDFSGETGRWTSLALYRTVGGKYVCHQIDHTQWQGEKTAYTACVCDDVMDVMDFFRYSDMAKEIYYEAGIEAVQTID